MDKHQKLDGLGRRAEELVAHAKKHGLQCFVIYEVKDHQVGIQQHCTEELLVNLAAHIGMNHPAAIHRARMIMIEQMGRKEVEAKEAEAEKAIILGMDGQPVKPAEA